MGDIALLKAFERLHRRLHAMAVRLLADDAAADDVLQEAFCRLWQRPAAADGGAAGPAMPPPPLSEERAGAMLAVTVRRLGIDRLRSEARHPHLALDEERDARPDDAADEGRLRERRLALLEAAVESCLTERQREVLHRHEYRGESFEQIAAALHMQPAAVRMQLSRARKAIRQYFKEHRP